MRNQLVHVWGSATNPVEYVYDGTYGDRTAMKTYRAGSNWATTNGDGSTGSNPWPSSSTDTADWTEWVYDPGTGLVSKKYDAANVNATSGSPNTGAKYVSYNYNARGQVSSIISEAGREIDYKYYGDTGVTGFDTGELYQVHHADGTTPDVTYQYVRTGQLNTVADQTGTRTFNYDGTSPVQLKSITLPGYYGGLVLTRQYDAVHRPDGFELGTAASAAADLTQTYNYNALGQFDHADISASAANGTSAAHTFKYGYNTGGLVGSVAVNGSSFAVSYTYDSQRNIIQTLSSKWGTTVVSQYDYGYNTIPQRETTKQSGTAFGDFGTTIWHTGYDAKGQVTSSADYIGTDYTISTNQMSDRNFYYAFDNAGNRKSASFHGNAGTLDGYTANALDQYDQRTNGYVRAAGTASTSSSITVAGGGLVWSGTGRQGNYWASDAPLATSSAAQGAQLTITASGTFNGTQYVRTDTSHTAYVLPQTQVLQHDVDGNLTSDGIWSYTYDSENRLIRMTSVTLSGYPNEEIDFQYDYLGRRVQKTVATWNGSAYVLSYGRRYLYDGNNLIAEFSTDGSTCGSLLRSYAWGLDVAGSLTATGGVGALLQITDHTTDTSYYPTYDGNGNVVALVRSTDGIVASAYEYSPFGELLRAGLDTTDLSTNQQTALKDQPFRFSTKQFDPETGLVYYGARYYSPSFGRFITRDPIEEAGGVNLYGFCGNDGIDRWDVNGNLFGDLRKAWDHTVGWAGKHIAQNWDHGRKYVMMAAAVVAGVFTAGAALEAYAALEGGAFVGGFWGAVSSVSLAGGWGAGWAAAAGAGFGFGSGVAMSLMRGASPGEALKAGAIGAVAGGVLGGISGALPGQGIYRSVDDVRDGYAFSGIRGATQALYQDATAQASMYGFRRIMTSIAHHEGMTLTEADVALTALSFTGDFLFGDREPLGGRMLPSGADGISGYQSRDFSEGILFTDSPILHDKVGMIFDTIDAALTFQGLPSATGWKAILSGTIKQISLGHSLGASEDVTLGAWGIIGPSNAAALPFGRIAPYDVNVINGNEDLVPGGWLSKLTNPWATIISVPFAGHNFERYYKGNMPPVPGT